MTPRYGPPKLRWLPSALALGDGDVGAERPRAGASTPSESGSNTWIVAAPPSCAEPKRSRTGSRRPYRLGCCTITHATSGPASGRPPRPSAPSAKISGSYPAPLPYVRRVSTCRPSTPAETSTRARPGVARARLTASASAVEPSYSDAFETSSAGELADHRLVLEQRLQHALRELGLVGRVGGVRTPIARRAPTPRPARSGRRRRRLRSTRARRALRLRAASAWRSATISGSDTPSARSSGRSRRTDGGICEKRSSSDARPIALEHRPHVVVRVGRVPHAGSSVARCEARPTGYGASAGDVLEPVLLDQGEVVALVEDLAVAPPGRAPRSRRTLRFFFVTSFWFSVVISM